MKAHIYFPIQCDPKVFVFVSLRYDLSIEEEFRLVGLGHILSRKEGDVGAFFNIEGHAPFVCPFGDDVEVCLQMLCVFLWLFV